MWQSRFQRCLLRQLPALERRFKSTMSAVQQLSLADGIVGEVFEPPKPEVAPVQHKHHKILDGLGDLSLGNSADAKRTTLDAPLAKPDTEDSVPEPKGLRPQTPYWSKIPKWKDTTMKEFLTYEWQVSRHIQESIQEVTDEE